MKLNKIQKIGVIALYISFMFPSLALISANETAQNKTNISQSSRVDDERKIKKIVEKFISENFSFLHSSNDYSLIDSNSDTFREFLEYRNKYRTETLDAVNLTKDKYEYVKYTNFKYNAINYLAEDTADLNLTAIKKSKYIGDPIEGESLFEYNVRVHKDNNEWKIWSANCNDDITNPFDSKENIDIIKISGYPSSKRSKISVNNDIDKIKNLYSQKIKEFEDALNPNI